MPKTDPHILVTNDDGVYAEGISVLRSALEEIGKVTVVAPERPRSATGHAITLHKPLRVENVRLPWGGRRLCVQRHAQRLRGAGDLRADGTLRPGDLGH